MREALCYIGLERLQFYYAGCFDTKRKESYLIPTKMFAHRTDSRAILILWEEFWAVLALFQDFVVFVETNT